MVQKMAFEYSKLRGKIREVYGTQSNFAKEMGISSASVSAKLNNAVEFKQCEIDKACSLLSINSSDVVAYFFTSKVQ